MSLDVDVIFKATEDVADEAREDKPETADFALLAALDSGAVALLAADFAEFAREETDAAPGMFDVSAEAFGRLGADGTGGRDGILGNLEVSPPSEAPPTSPPKLPTVFEEKSGFFTPDIIPSKPFGFGIEGLDKLGILGNEDFGIFGTLTDGTFGIFTLGKLGAPTFGMDGKLGDES